jgi:hypothetical protein
MFTTRIQNFTFFFRNLYPKLEIVNGNINFIENTSQMLNAYKKK